MLFTLTDIALDVTWKVSTYTLKIIYNGLYYLCYGNNNVFEEKKMSLIEMTEKIKELEEKLDKLEKGKLE
jgi:hypothetical protein